MLRVIQMSGEEVAAVPLEEVSSMKALKQLLNLLNHQYGLPPRFRQRLLLNGTDAILDDNAELHASMNSLVLQILKTPLRSPSPRAATVLTLGARHVSPAQAGSTKPSVCLLH